MSRNAALDLAQMILHVSPMSANPSPGPQTNAEDELYLVDGSGFIFRAYYAMAYSGRGNMTNPQGIPVSAVYGFTSMLLKMLKDYHAPYIAVIFDAARTNFRNDIYPQYKANRDETPEDLIPQFPLIHEATKAFDIPAIALEGFEADDLIAAYTRCALEKGKRVTIVSSDKDLMQLIRPGVRILDPMKNVFCDEKDVIEKFGVTPDKVADVQALAGDSTDNVPGVPGIGLKIAAELINQYGTLEELLSRATEIKQQKRREKLIEYAELARISKRLVSLDAHAPMPLALEELKARDPDKPSLMAFLQEHGFNSIIKRLGGEPIALPVNAILTKQGTLEIHDENPRLEKSGEIKTWPSVSENLYELIHTEAQLLSWIEEIRKAGTLCIDTETTSLTPAKAKLVGISMACMVGKACYIPVGHVSGQSDLLSDNTTPALPQLPLERSLELLRPVLVDPSIIKIGHNMKYDWQMFAKHGIEINPCDDTLLMSYVLDGSRHGHGMDFLAKHYLGHDTIKYEDVAGKGKNAVTFDKVEIEKARDYAAEDADVTLRLWHILKPRLAAEKMTRVYENIERPLIPVIGRMELEGIKVDPQILKSMSADFGQRIAGLEQEIQKLAGTAFNVGSPKQIGEILFEQMSLPGGSKTKTGQWSTDVGALEELAEQGHDIVKKILDWRMLSKLKSTYTDALQEEINPATGRVHTSYHMSGTSTGRLASSDPNLQNIPIRTEEGRKIRQAFVAQEGYVLLSADYSQVELRLAAELAGVTALKQAFQDKVDIHTLTASQVFDVPLQQVTPEIRRRAKAVNFGIIYGISGYGLSKQLGIPQSEASEFIRRYLNKFSEIKEYMEAKKIEAHQFEYVRTLYGRKCFTPYINSKIPAQRSGAERAAINAPLQGTAADIMKIAMIKIPPALKDAGLSARMLLQVHDELIFEVPQSEMDTTAQLVKRTMENCCNIQGVQITVPLEVDTGTGHSWADAH